MTNVVLIDGSNIAHAADNGPKLSVGSFFTQAIYGTIRSVHCLKRDYWDWQPVMLWDGRADWRYDLYPGYKAGRLATTPEEQKVKDSYQAQVVFIRKALQLLGVSQVLAKSAEADDLAGYMAGRLSTGDHLIQLLSGDQDWLQLVDKNTQWLDPVRDRKVTASNFFEQTGYFNTQAFIEGKALIGDTSDSIEGVLRIGEKKAPEILAQFKSVAEFFRQVDAGEFKPKYVIHKNLASEEGRAIFARNMKLMDLRSAPKPPVEDVVSIPANFNPALFRKLCEKLAFHSLLRDFDNFLKPFKA